MATSRNRAKPGSGKLTRRKEVTIVDEKKFPVHVEMDVTLTQQDIDDIMSTALDYIGYWCGKAKVVGEYLGEFASDQISRGGSLILHDAESSDKWELTLDKFLKGVGLYIKEGSGVMVEDFKLVDIGCIDGPDADCIIQYALFGELVFG